MVSKLDGKLEARVSEGGLLHWASGIVSAMLMVAMQARTSVSGSGS
jgi:hypothetical protein